MRIRMKLLSTIPLLLLIILAMGTLQMGGCSLEASSNSGPSLAASEQRPLDRRLVELKIDLSPPEKWKLSPMKKTGTHVEQAWESPSGKTTMGVVYIHVPPFMPRSVLIKSVKKNYVKDQPGGEIIRQWIDSSNRHWFEVRADETNSKGFIIAGDGKAWFAYYQYQTNSKARKNEIKQAENGIKSLKPTEKY